MFKKLINNRHAEHFRAAMVAVLVFTAISLAAFMTEENKGATGFVTGSDTINLNSDLRGYDGIDSIRSLAKGNYYIDDNGVLYWLDDDSRPAIGIVYNIRDIYKGRFIYIDHEGNIGYLIK